MGVEEEYQAFIESHVQARTGERLRRLKEGHGHAEKMFLTQVWWPLFYQFRYLHPEYEVNDYKDGTRFLDFAYIRPAIRICFEMDGYGPHQGNISRWQFIDNLERQNQLVIDGWTVIRFSYDQIKDHPRRCQQVVQQVLSRWLGDKMDQTSLTVWEKEVIRLAIRKGEAVSPIELERYLKISGKTVKNILIKLVDKKMLVPSSGTARIRTYRLGEQVKFPVWDN